MIVPPPLPIYDSLGRNVAHDELDPGYPTLMNNELEKCMDVPT